MMVELPNVAVQVAVQVQAEGGGVPLAFSLV